MMDISYTFQPIAPCGFVGVSIRTFCGIFGHIGHRTASRLSPEFHAFF